MLAKRYRLSKNKDFAKLARRGQAAFVRDLGFKWIKNNLPYSRFGIVVSLKVDKRAVVRNRVKRVIRAILKENLSQIVKGYDFLILTKAGIKESNYREIKNKLLNILKRNDLVIGP